MSDIIINSLGDSSLVRSIYAEHGLENFSKCIEMANLSQAQGNYTAAVFFFEAACGINRQSHHALLAKFKAQHSANIGVDQAEIDVLRSVDPGFADYFEVYSMDRSSLSGVELLSVLEKLGSAVESFPSGSEPDWLYLRLARNLLQPSQAAYYSNSPISNNLFMYWDKEVLPSAIRENVDYHRSLGRFNVNLFHKESAAKFLKDYFGSECCRAFLSLRHPAEESDFFRWHIVYAEGGYFIDADDQIISIENLDRFANNSRSCLFFLANSGPIRTGFFGATRRNKILEECIRVVTYNCMYHPNLSMWLKTGPGVATRALVRDYNRALFRGEPVPDVTLRDESLVACIIRAVDVDYRGDTRDWRVFEASQGA